jgi:hypothetical protein
VPLAQFELRRAVVRASTLPGLATFGPRTLVLPSCDHADDEHLKSCERVPDRLVDGGISGIFGQRLLVPRGHPGEADPPRVLVVDSGRKLVPNNGTEPKSRLMRLIEDISAVALLARWLQVAFDIGYREDLRKVAASDPEHDYVLVRLAEDDDLGERAPEDESRPEPSELDRLFVARDRVHRLSIFGVRPWKTNLAIATGIVACALLLDSEPKVSDLLERADGALQRGGRLTAAWNDLRVVRLGKPI